MTTFSFRIAVLAYATWAAGVWVSTAAARENCTPLKFETGATSAVVRGVAPPEDPRDPLPSGICYSIDVGDGQTARIRFRSDGNVAVTVPGVGDMREDLEFKTRRGTYRLEVWQLSPTTSEVPFEMRVEVLP
ncbi:hypothetical protein U0C82_16750 [Fulvimarina sp. 2208YS6-2-32]|uniref:Uncharacterized protein n=1 Tax=Fulvimarina uroteuthidis TaxID=3098149 RepID=A0ABU5I5Z4_9HYPH|nr:hypothetical protein [Fulvimarina sp. 2208YS6-2-32]MDY8110792.1 hypothetical protein [Fulvimarina sp. 2208YS6-2-32]